MKISKNTQQQIMQQIEQLESMAHYVEVNPAVLSELYEDLGRLVVAELRGLNEDLDNVGMLFGANNTGS